MLPQRSSFLRTFQWEVQYGLDLPDMSLPLSDLQRLLRLPETLEEQDMKKGELLRDAGRKPSRWTGELSSQWGRGGFCSALSDSDRRKFLKLGALILGMHSASSENTRLIVVAGPVTSQGLS